MATSQDSIKAAYRELIAKFPFEEVTIKAVCASAGVSRKTFNRYFDALDQVAAVIIHDDTVKKSQILVDTLPLSAMKDSSEVVYTATYRAMYDNRVFYKKIVEGYGMMWLVDTLSKQSLTVAGAYARNDIPVTDRNFAKHFFAGVNAMTVKWWIERDFDVAPEELAAMVVRWAYPHLESLPKQ